MALVRLYRVFVALILTVCPTLVRVGHDQSPATAIAAAYTAQAEGEVDAAAELDADASMGDITMSEVAA